MCAKTLSARRPARISGLSQLLLHTVITGCVVISHEATCVSVLILVDLAISDEATSVSVLVLVDLAATT